MLNGTVHSSLEGFGAQLVALQVLEGLAERDVSGSAVRVVDHDVRPGVELDMGAGDVWPQIRQVIVDSDFLVLAARTWMGQPGDEDGARHVSAVAFQCLHDVGFTISGQGVTYGNGEARQTIDDKDLPHTPERTASATRTLAADGAHLAKLLRDSPYPGVWVVPAEISRSRA